MSDPYGYPTPSQAEGEREPEPGNDQHPDVARSTPSQAEGERTAETEEVAGEAKGKDED
ncbi:hypothetical protein ACIRNI_25170 [Streptomyces sp. NPDC093546]|uniref:hypothetical protein n=1 Tax=Streptomyces sp. NPDC093546 TaxID=3366040 RepID=UPI00382A429A